MRLFPAKASDYPSQLAVEQLSARWAAEGVWALAVLGGATLSMAETGGLLQVSAALSLHILAMFLT